MKIIEEGTRVKYMHYGEQKKGVVHGYRQYEDESGQVSRITYLIVKDGKLGHIKVVKPKHEQIEVDQNLVEEL